MAGPTYQGLFPKVAMLPPSVQHCIWMITVPIIYPRLEAAEQIAHTVATGKKAVTGAYNVLGKVTSSVAGVVGAKAVVGSGFDSVKRAVGKSGLMGGILSPFGDIDMLDELKDQWTHESKVSLTLPLPPPTLEIPSLSLTPHPGPRAHLPHPHPARHLAPEIHPHDLPLRRGRLLRRGPGARPLQAVGPQDDVPAHLGLGRQHGPALVRAEAAAQQQAAVRAAERAPQHGRALRHQGGHDGDLPGRARRPPARAEEAHGPQELRRHGGLRPGGRAGELRPHGHGQGGGQVELGGGFYGPGRWELWRSQ